MYKKKHSIYVCVGVVVVVSRRLTFRSCDAMIAQHVCVLFVAILHSIFPSTVCLQSHLATMYVMPFE